jgi:hypothetical protein
LENSTEDFPQLVEKWKTRGNHNQNVQNILAEKCNEEPRITVFTHRGAKTGVDVTNGGKHTEQWVRKSAWHMLTLDPRQENVTYRNSRKEIIGQDWGASTSTHHMSDIAQSY